MLGLLRDGVVDVHVVYLLGLCLQVLDVTFVLVGYYLILPVLRAQGLCVRIFDI